MGIQDRDYMKRPRTEDRSYSSSLDEKWEGFFSGFLQRHPLLLKRLGIILAGLLLASLLCFKLLG